MIQDQLTALAGGHLWAPLGGLVIGMLLSLSPVSLPGLAAALATFPIEARAVTSVEVHVVSAFAALEGDDLAISEIEFFTKG